MTAQDHQETLTTAVVLTRHRDSGRSVGFGIDRGDAGPPWGNECEAACDQPWPCDAYVMAEAAARPVTSAGLYVERLKAMVGRTSHMGTCSQTHHEHLMLDARALLSAGDKAEAPPQDFGEQIVAESHLGRRIAGGQ